MSTLPDLHTLLRRLIEIPSVSSVSPAFDQSNLPLIEVLAEFCQSAGFEVSIQPLPGRPGKANLVATLGHGEAGLLLAGHTDTVPCDPALWDSDPFCLTERDGKLYGLGTSDMKSFFALVLEAVRGIKAEDLHRPLILLATADEESSMEGAKLLTHSAPLPARYAVIGEPTNLIPVRMHKGILMEGIRLTGRSGHSSNPALGINALEGMYAVIGELLAWRDTLQKHHHHPLFSVPHPTLNLGHIHGGDNPNRICGQCELHIDLRPLPGMALDELRHTLRERLAPIAQRHELGLELFSLFEGIPAMETPADSRLVTTLEALTGATAQAVAFGTEAPYLHALGMDVVICGPGDIAQAHQHNEYLAIERIAPSITLLRQLIQRFCCTA